MTEDEWLALKKPVKMLGCLFRVMPHIEAWLAARSGRAPQPSA
jgi:hypothetical protein